MKKAKLVQVIFTTRVIVDENADGQYDYEKLVADTKANLLARIANDEVEENIETVFDDDEVPYDESVDK